MLILTRKKNQKVDIVSPCGNVVITVTILEVDRNKVRVGFVGPKEWHILRDDMKAQHPVLPTAITETEPQPAI